MAAVRWLGELVRQGKVGRDDRPLSRVLNICCPNVESHCCVSDPFCQEPLPAGILPLLPEVSSHVLQPPATLAMDVLRHAFCAAKPFMV